MKMYNLPELRKKAKERVNAMLGEYQEENLRILNLHKNKLYAELSNYLGAKESGEFSSIQYVLNDINVVETVYDLIEVNEKAEELVFEFEPNSIYSRLIGEEANTNNVILNVLLRDRQWYIGKLENDISGVGEKENSNKPDISILPYYDILVKEESVIRGLIKENYDAMTNSKYSGLYPKDSEFLTLAKQFTEHENRDTPRAIFSDRTMPSDRNLEKDLILEEILVETKAA